MKSITVSLSLSTAPSCQAKSTPSIAVPRKVSCALSAGRRQTHKTDLVIFSLGGTCLFEMTAVDISASRCGSPKISNPNLVLQFVATVIGFSEYPSIFVWRMFRACACCKYESLVWRMFLTRARGEEPIFTNHRQNR